MITRHSCLGHTVCCDLGNNKLGNRMHSSVLFDSQCMVTDSLIGNSGRVALHHGTHVTCSAQTSNTWLPNVDIYWNAHQWAEFWNSRVVFFFLILSVLTWHLLFLLSGKHATVHSWQASPCLLGSTGLENDVIGREFATVLFCWSIFVFYIWLKILLDWNKKQENKETKIENTININCLV